MSANRATYRWVEGPTADDADWQRIDDFLATRKHMSLNRLTSRVLIAEVDGVLVGTIAVQLMPTVGSLIVHPRHYGTGIADELADQMMEFLLAAEARGWMVVAASAHTEKLCRDRNMQVLESPVYVTSEV